MNQGHFSPPRWQILPPVVKNLMIINGILYFATVVFEGKLGLDLNRYLALYFPTSEYFVPHQYITHLFMHGGLLHLFSNMFALWMFGNILENVWGPRRFLTFYLVTGIGAAVIHTFATWYDLVQMRQQIEFYLSSGDPVDFRELLFRYGRYIDPYSNDQLKQFISEWMSMPESEMLRSQAREFGEELLRIKENIPTVGASGAVFGVLLAFGMMFPDTIIYIYFAIPMKAKWFVLLYGLFELYSGFRSNPDDNVAHFAHLGGMLFGYLLIRHWRRTSFHQNRDYF